MEINQKSLVLICQSTLCQRPQIITWYTFSTDFWLEIGSVSQPNNRSTVWFCFFYYLVRGIFSNFKLFTKFFKNISVVNNFLSTPIYTLKYRVNTFWVFFFSFQFSIELCHCIIHVCYEWTFFCSTCCTLVDIFYWPFL